MNDYQICGLRVRSGFELPYPSIGVSGDADIRVEAGAVPALPPGDGTSPATFGAVDGTIVLAVDGLGRMQAAGGCSIVVDVRSDAPLEDVQLYVAGAMLGAIWHQRGIFPLHASALRFGDGAIAIAGRTGAGKSTLAAFLSRRGHDLVSDDMCVLAALASGEIGTWPGPARIKLGEDGLSRLGVAPSSLEGAGGTRGKFHLPAVRTADVRPTPLRRIYLIAAGDQAPHVERLDSLSAVDAVAGHAYAPEFAQALGLEAHWLRAAVDVARRVSVRRLVRPMGYQHMDRVLDTLEADVLRD